MTVVDFTPRNGAATNGAKAPAERSATAQWSERVTTSRRAWFTEPPTKRRWLLRDDRTALSSGVLPLGKVGMLIGEGGVSKTMALVALTIAVATGTNWLGCYIVATQGRVLALLGEEDAEEVHRRCYHVARATGARVPDDGSIVVVPLAGVPCAMIETDEHGNAIDSPFLAWFREWLRAEIAARGPFALIVVDPLSRFAGADAEIDNAAATRFVQALESIATEFGVTVIVAHHTNKLARGNGAPVSGAAARGSSAIFDGVRWAAALSAERIALADPADAARLGELVTLAIVKSNYSRKGAPLRLRRDGEHNGALLPLDSADVATVTAAQKAADPTAVRREAKDANARERAVSIEETVLAIVRATPRITTRGICAAVRQQLGSCTDALVFGAIAKLCDHGVVFREGKRETGFRHTAGASEPANQPASQEVLRASRSPL